MTKGKSYFLAATALVAGLVLIGNRAEAEGDRFYSDLIRLDKIVTKINENYVEPVSSEELVDAAIDGMRDILDPHTAYFDARDYEDLKVSTEGEFGGLGIQIGMRDQVLTVISPLAGTPAHRLGLRAGDKILRIDTADTRGITVDKAVDKLRGKAGTKVTLRIRREGVADPLDFTITREIIKIESVPYAAMLGDSIGYVKVTQFARLTGSDLENKVAQLIKRHPRGLILDLRMNPGGLLSQAIEVSELFLAQGSLVVFTKGRASTQSQEFKSRRAPLWTGKLVVLVNGSSASASEIVAGAVQDWDRGIILGQNTYGKGSVQTVLPLDDRDNALKLTTAYYYTPAGRCINKPENGARLKALAAEEGDTAALQKAAKTDTVLFKTHGGRLVKAAGGITPDIAVADRKYSRFALELFRRGLFFGYVVKARGEISARTPVTPAFEVTPEILEDFRRYAFADSAFRHFRSAPLQALDQARAAWKKDRADRGDTAQASTPEFDRAYASLEAVLKAEAEHEFAANRELIRREIKAELLGAVLGEDARTAFELQGDAQVREALRYLGDAKLYANALKISSKAAKPSKSK
jgi:carboxyl-terminal processing protease